MAGISVTQRARRAWLLTAMAAATVLVGANIPSGAWAEPVKKTSKPVAPTAAKTSVAVVVPLPIRKPDIGYAHPGVRGPRPARIEALLPPVRFKVRRSGGKFVRREIGRRPPAELIAAAKARMAKSPPTEAKMAPISMEQ